MRTHRLIAVALLSVAALGCGHRGAPSPPLPRAPAPARDVAWRQRGDRLEVRATHHLLGVGGSPLRPPVRPVILHVTPRSRDDCGGWDAPSREREFLRNAKMLDLPPFGDQQLGDARTRIDAAPLSDVGPPEWLVLALALRDRRSRSASSPRVLLRPVWPPLAPLPAFSAASEEGGVRLRWTAPDDRRVGFVRVYRWAAGATEPWKWWRSAPVEDGGLLDETARFGENLSYGAATAAGPADPPVESALREAAVAHRDLFPPLPPRELDAVAETGAIRVLWYPGGSPDEEFVRVERQEEGDDRYQRIGEVKSPDSFFTDEAVEFARRYRYRIVAIDAAGNASAATGPTDWIAPRRAP